VPEPTVLAYLAGIIDSDGYITIQRSRHSGRTYFGARLGIAGTRRQPHDLAASLWGGTVSLYTPRDPHHRGQYQWSRSGQAAASAIAQLLPYLRVKLDQAHLALALHEHVLFGRSDDPYPWFGPNYCPRADLDEMAAAMRDMNQSRRAGRVLDGRTWDEYPARAITGGTP
jgi:hypothetical protein